MRAEAIHLIGGEIDLGANQRGVSLGPKVFRAAGIKKMLSDLSYKVVDHGDIIADPDGKVGKPNLKYFSQVYDFSERLTRKVRTIVKMGGLPLIIGGDHSVIIGALAGTASRKKKQGLIAFDAHGDFNNPKSTLTGNIHGMGIAISCGYGDRKLVHLGGFAPKVLEQNTVIIGVRDLDPEERRLLAKSKVRVFAIDEIDRIGILKVIEMAMHIASRGTDLVHLSFDMDVLDPSEAPAVGYTISGGMTFREIRTCLEILHKLGIPSSVDISEVNTTLDIRNRTASIGVQLLQSAFGKKLY